MAPSSVSSAPVCTEVSKLSSDLFIVALANPLGFGVHISFVRSITMDKWSDEQLKKMKVCRSSQSANKVIVKKSDHQLGGNEAFKQFMESYGAGGGYSKGIGMQEKYNCWAATQYREKVCLSCLPATTLLTRSASRCLCRPATAMVRLGSTTPVRDRPSGFRPGHA